MSRNRVIPVMVLLACSGSWSGLAPIAPARAELVRDGAPPTDARAVYELVRVAFETGDEQVLADLVHVDGLQVRSGGTGSRDAEYSPSQAYYYFRNLFQSHRTVAFVYLRREESAAGERIHALARWTHRQSGREGEKELRLVIVLRRQDAAWRLAEITTIG